MSELLNLVEQKYTKKEVPQFQVGNRVKVHLKVKEGDKTRTQVFEGVVIRKRGSGTKATFTVLKKTKASGYAVEKTFPLHSPIVEKVTLVTKKVAKRAKLYYLRDSISKKF